MIDTDVSGAVLSLRRIHWSWLQNWFTKEKPYPSELGQVQVNIYTAFPATCCIPLYLTAPLIPTSWPHLYWHSHWTTGRLFIYVSMLNNIPGHYKTKTLASIGRSWSSQHHENFPGTHSSQASEEMIHLIEKVSPQSTAARQFSLNEWCFHCSCFVWVLLFKTWGVLFCSSGWPGRYSLHRPGWPKTHRIPPASAFSSARIIGFSPYIYLVSLKNWRKACGLLGKGQGGGTAVSDLSKEDFNANQTGEPSYCITLFLRKKHHHSETI